MRLDSTAAESETRAPNENSISLIDLHRDTQAMTEPDIKLWLSKGLSSDKSELESYEEHPHKYLRPQCEFSGETAAFLERYTKSLPALQYHDGSHSYFIPVHGISNRMLNGDSSYTPKYYYSVMEVTVPHGAKNLDQCWFRRGPRQEESKDQFLGEIKEELSGALDLKAHDGPLSFFTHGAFSGAGVVDTDSVRLAMLSGVPTITIDWRSTPGPWYTLPLRYPIDFAGAVSQEKSFEDALDSTFSFLNPSKASMVCFSRGAAFNAAYLQHRYENKQVPLSGNIFAHSDLASSAFRARIDGYNPIVGASKSTIVLGNPHDAALRIGSWRIFGDRVGDAQASDVDAVLQAGGKYVIDDFQRRGGNFNHYVDYKIIAKMLQEMCNQKGQGVEARLFADRLSDLPGCKLMSGR